MATTTLGAQLTELQYRQQVALRASVMQDTLRLAPVVDASSIDAVTETWPPLEEALKTLIEARYGDSSGIAANYFEMFRAAEGIDGTASALLADPLPETQILTALRTNGLYETRHQLALKAPDVAENMITRVLGTTTRLVGDGGRNTLDRSVRGDHRALGFARVTSGRACAFCSMLASRGPVYKHEMGGFRSHDHCSCTSEPVYSTDQPWPGNGRDLRDLWDESTKGVRGERNMQARFRRALDEKRAPDLKAAEPPKAPEPLPKAVKAPAKPKTARAAQKPSEPTPTSPAPQAGPTAFATKSEATAWGKQHFSDWAANLPAEQKEALKTYTGSGYQRMNRALRGQLPSTVSDSAQLRKLNEDAAKALFKAELPEDVKVVRGGFFEQRFNPGDTMRDDGFVSTAMGNKVPSTVKHNTVFEIDLPKGTKGAYVGDVSAYGKGEAEFLMPPGASFEVTAVEKKGSKRLVKMRLVSQDSATKSLTRARTSP